MTDQEIIKTLAEKVMGFDIIGYGSMTGYGPDTLAVAREKDGEIFEFSPLESWNDCGVLVEKASKEGFNIYFESKHNGCVYDVEVHQADGDEAACLAQLKEQASPTRAISMAIYEAVKDE